MKNKRLITICLIILCSIFLVYFKTSKKYDIKTSDRYQAILAIENNDVIIAPSNYDRDSHELFVKDFETLKLNKNVECFNLSIRSEIDKNGKKTSEETYKELTLDELKHMLEDSFLTAYLWLDHQSEVTVIMLYGETIVYE